MVARLRRQALPARDDVFARGVVVAGDEQQQVALLVAIERFDAGGVDGVAVGAGGLRDVEKSIDEARDAEREDRVHVVPELPFGEHFGRVALFAGAEAVGEVVEERIEVVVLDDEQLAWPFSAEL